MQRKTGILCLAMLLGLLGSTQHQSALASPLFSRSQPPSQPGFPLVLDGSYVELASLTVADLNADGKKEIIFGNRVLNADGSFGCGGKVYAIKPDGTKLWETTV